MAKQRKTITYAEIRELSPTELGKMGKSQLADLLRKIRVKNQIRLEQLDKETSIYSQAAFNLHAFYERNGYQSPSKMTRNKVMAELIASVDFHKARTGTVEGSKQVAKEQDIRIFGATKTGRPKKRMTKEQRIRFWALYGEFSRLYKNAEYLYGSNRIQQALGQMVKGGRAKSIGSIGIEELDELFDMLESEMREEQGDYEFDDANVYSGRWTD